MVMAKVELNKTGRGFHIKGKPGPSPAVLLEHSIELLRDADYPVRGTTLVTPRVLVFVNGFTADGQESPIHTGNLQREMVRYGQWVLGL